MEQGVQMQVKTGQTERGGNSRLIGKRRKGPEPTWSNIDSVDITRKFIM